MSVSIIKRIVTAYVTMGRTFNTWISSIFTGFLLLNLRISVSFFMLLDYIFFPSFSTKKIKSPIIIVGNPRSGTTFLHRYLIKNKFGNGSELWQLIYTSITMQKLIRPLLPMLNKFSPTKHHSTDAHKTSLTSIETDDASMLFRFFDGFFMYGFILAWNKEKLFDWIDPKVRDMSRRDYDWFESMWKRTLIYHDSDRMVGKLFSVSANAPAFIINAPPTVPGTPIRVSKPLIFRLFNFLTNVPSIAPQSTYTLFFLKTIFLDAFFKEITIPLIPSSLTKIFEPDPKK